MPPTDSAADLRRSQRHAGTATVLTPSNAAYPWDDFDPDWYVAHNYVEMREDDRRILSVVRDFFTRAEGLRRSAVHGIDVGAGPNLYPALAMLPFCRHLLLYERGLRNVEWLQRQVESYSDIWNPYWDFLCSHERYRVVDNPRQHLKAVTNVRWGDLFKLPRRQWDIGTMFFVAESISDQEREFNGAVRRFLRSLRRGAPFAIALMKDSAGYWVAGERFPAVAVSKTDVEHCLRSFAEAEVIEVRSSKPLREGYQGMLVAIGHVKGKAGN